MAPIKAIKNNGTHMIKEIMDITKKLITLEEKTLMLAMNQYCTKGGGRGWQMPPSPW
jgi:hypothetical protein